MLQGLIARCRCGRDRLIGRGNDNTNDKKMGDASGRKGPLTHILLVELGQLSAGPFCGQLMADMGADVIKVEPPGQGDPMRAWGRGDYPLWWQVCARNKRVVTANLREAEGQALVRTLIAEEDMGRENVRAGPGERGGRRSEKTAEKKQK